MYKIILILSLIILLACNRKPEPAAIINGKEISLEQVDSKINDQLIRILERIYRIRKQALDTIINETLLDLEAKNRNISKSKLLALEADNKVTDSLINTKAFEMSGDSSWQYMAVAYKFKSPDEKKWFTEYLQREKRNEYFDSLRKKYENLITVSLKSPERFKPQINPDKINVRYKMRKKTDNTFIVVGNYDCENCKAADPVFNELSEKFKEKYSYGFIFYDNMPTLASRAAEAASLQGKFWELHEQMMHSHEMFDSSAIFSLAKVLNLNMSKFEKDFRNPVYEKKIATDSKLLEEYGIRQTPTVIINGKIYSGPFNKKALGEYLEDNSKS